MNRRPESVLVVVHSDDSQVLLLRRVTPFDFWQSVTGSLQHGESPANAAIRELFEETGLRNQGRLTDTQTARIFTIDPRWRHRFSPGVTENREHEWRYRLPAPCDVRLNAAEHCESRWLPIDDAIATVWSWTNREALESLRSELPSRQSGSE